MKKILIGLVISFTLFSSVPTQANFLSNVTSTFNDIGGAVRQVGGIVGGIGGIVNSVRGLFGGGGGGGGSRAGVPATGLFDGEAARIFEGGLQGGLNIGVDNVVSSGVVIVQDFDAIFQSIEGRVGVTPTGQFVLPDPEKFNQIGENTSLRQYILNVLNFALTFLGLIAVAFIIYAGYLYVISGGDDGNMEKAKKIILYAVIGILVILAAYALVNTVIQNAGRGTGDRGEVPPVSGTVGTVGGPTIGGPVIVGPGGTVTGPGSGTNTPVIPDNLQSLVSVTGAGVQDFGSTAVVTLAGAQSGVTFGLNTQAQALFDFGDGTQGILNTIDNPGATIVHPYGEMRSYPVRVIIETVEGSFTTRKEIVVGGITADFNMNRAEVSVGESLGVNAGNSQVTVGSIRSFNWSCSGGAGCFADTFGQNANLEFSAPGEYTITLTVENVLGMTDSTTRTIRVIGGQPVASFNFDSTGASQRPAEFTFNATQSVNRVGTSAGLTYFWNFDGDFQETNAQTITYEFDSVGSKTVELVTVEMVQGQPLRSDIFSQQVDVQTVIPVDFTIE